MLTDLKMLACDMASRPTRIAKIIPSHPSVIGTCDAAGAGMGGVFFFPTKDGAVCPYLWRKQFPTDITNNLVTHMNLKGTINNSNLELCGNIAHHNVIASTADIRKHTVHTMLDNVAAAFWLRKGSTTTVKPPAFLLRLQAYHQRHHRYAARHDYIRGQANAMADDCLRLWYLTDADLLAHFNTTYPQTVPWQQCHLSKPMFSGLTSALRRIPSTPQLFQLSMNWDRINIKMIIITAILLVILN